MRSAIEYIKQINKHSIETGQKETSVTYQCVALPDLTSHCQRLLYSAVWGMLLGTFTGVVSLHDTTESRLDMTAKRIKLFEICMTVLTLYTQLLDITSTAFWMTREVRPWLQIGTWLPDMNVSSAWPTGICVPSVPSIEADFTVIILCCAVSAPWQVITLLRDGEGVVFKNMSQKINLSSALQHCPAWVVIF